MKTISRICTIITVSAALFAGCATRASFVVHERPAEIVYERPAPPYDGAVWIPGEWVWRDGRYVRTHGYYVRASSRVWVEGHWRPAPGGYVWDRGHWR
ncbi:YXWGXW repeat-containing protein [Mucilaginibacter paludis]|uniref:YXWGXW repeat-containing protein n=1 Tax=Mucilaginibacter paludis DSM 18603 TaxID=714943 RepID=H1Y9J7_9SPHI|nr:YXWGXW repeat-containing protein [Mucilaginibacter paludis]EHQ30499.1 hypothetical protein Mucpa_6446 [Mucilaginibacter paludis DSM 18603]